MRAQEHALVGSAPVDTTAAVSVYARLLPDTVYVGQQLLYQLVVFVDERSRDRVRRMEAIPPEMRGMMAYEAPQRSGVLPTRVINRRRFEPYIYQRPIFPLTAGELVVPPSRLVYAMPVSSSFFSRVESMELWSDSARVIVIEPPAEGRPADFRGAVGQLRVEASLDSRAARVGDPMTLVLRVSGRGNVKLLPRPEIEIQWATLVPAGDRVRQGPDSLLIDGMKEFRWVLTPTLPGIQRLPALRYAYFDPDHRQYVIVETEPRDVPVAEGSLARLETPAPAGRPAWEIRSTYRGALPPPAHTTLHYWLLVAIAPLPALALLARRRPSREGTHGRRRKHDTLANIPADATPTEVRRAFIASCARRIRVTGMALSDPESFERHARRAGVTPRTAREGADLVRSLNAAAFGPQLPPPERFLDRSVQLFRLIDQEAVKRHWRRTPAIVILAALTGMSASTFSSAADRDAQRFADGVAAYQVRDYSAAAAAFEEVSRRVPRAADAWANLGTASFAAGDSVRAAWGWQRAIRLEPLASDVRDRIIVLGDPASGGRAAVPAIPVPVLFLLGGAVWLLGWLVAAVRVWRREPARSMAVVTTFAALLIVGAAWSLDQRIAGADLVVLSRTESLRYLPSLGAEREGTALSGSVARIAERRGGWARIEAGERTGWVEEMILLPLARD
jgi:hypothetical protein